MLRNIGITVVFSAASDQGLFVGPGLSSYKCVLAGDVFHDHRGPMGRRSACGKGRQHRPRRKGFRTESGTRCSRKGWRRVAWSGKPAMPSPVAARPFHGSPVPSTQVHRSQITRLESVFAPAGSSQMARCIEHIRTTAVIPTIQD